MKATAARRDHAVHSVCKRALLAAALACLLSVLAPAGSARADARVHELDFFARTNLLRVSKGLVPLVVDFQMTEVARSWSAEMARNDTLSHNPNLQSQIADWRHLGENVGVGPTVASIEDAFEASPGHYANLVDPEFRNVGIGVVESGGLIWVTVDFKTPESAPALARLLRPSQPPAAPPPHDSAPAPAPPPRPRPRPSAPPTPPPTTTPVVAVAAAPSSELTPYTPTSATPVVPTVTRRLQQRTQAVASPKTAPAAKIWNTRRGWGFLALAASVVVTALFLYRRRGATVEGS